MDKYAVIGNPIQHSLSPQIYQAFAKQINEFIDYRRIESPRDAFENTVNTFFSNGGKACNITTPFKEKAFLIADQASTRAQLAEAANSLTLKSDGSLYADNTDGIGLVQDLSNNSNIALRHQSILIIGAGGATRGILGPLLEKLPARVIVANRSLEKAEHLAETFQLHGHISAQALDQLAECESPFDLVIHATPLGHEGLMPTLPSSIINPHTTCYDLSYGQAALPFLDWAKAHGAKQCLSGLGMLVEQAAATFAHWYGLYPNTQGLLTTGTFLETA